MTSIQQALASGEIVAAMAWNDAYAAFQRENVPITDMFNPEEDLRIWASCMVLNKDAEPPDLAYDLMISMTSPEAGGC